ncbi:phytanoyl-CoA dioxygenase family protein [Poriferisphaera sp. WC338]|uniref:phytanoyl-CoA dioxygenase family protein n=1 Tax=Poriferisphaera sp. WC338 TaxID=3425129 RepID=UPI003D81A591
MTTQTKSNMTTYAKPRLTAEQVAQYHTEGYLLPKQQVYSPTKFQKLVARFDELLEEWQHDPRMRSPEHMDVPHLLHPDLFDWIFDDAVLDLVEPIIGPDIALFASHFICKPAGKGKRVPWHEDSGYWRGRLDPMNVVTVWLAVDPSTPNNGCMRVIPGTHNSGKAGFSDYVSANAEENVFDSEIDPSQYDESKAVDCVLDAGEASLHDGRIIHGSNANTGNMRRCGYTMRFISTAVKHTDNSKDQLSIYLARGKDRAGNRYGDPTKVNQAYIDAHKDGFPAGH